MKKEVAGEISIFVSCIFFSVATLLVKVVSETFDGTFIALFRFITGIILGLIVLKSLGEAFKIRHKATWMLRGFLGSFGMVFFFTAIQLTGTGRATLLAHTSPIFVATFGYLCFKEHLNLSKIVSIGLCFIGVGFVFYDGSMYSTWGNLLGLSVGIMRGLAAHVIKQSVKHNHPIIVYLSACFWGLLLLPFSGHQAIHLTFISGILLALIGILTFSAQVFLTYGYRYVTAIKGILLTYMNIPLTMMFGYVLGEKFGPRFFIGIFCIFVGLLINICSYG
jgi:drug/metabolite transporter (DMT)-like permease